MELIPAPSINFDDSRLAEFVGRQLHQFGGKVEVEGGLWALFAVESGDEEGGALARLLLADAPFQYDCGTTEDDRWTLFYIDAASQAAAVHWLDDIGRRFRGEIRLPSPAHRRSIHEMLESPMPHRVAQGLVEQHARGELSAGSVSEPAVLRALLDRLHAREPLFFSAFQQLLAHHLLDLVALLDQLIAEDVELVNESLRGSVSRDPFLRSRQTAAAEIRNAFVTFFLINSLDQQKNTSVKNPYAAYLDIVGSSDDVTLTIDGATVPVSRANFTAAIRSIRRRLYSGGAFDRFDTQAPWVSEGIAYPFRFIKQRLEMHRELTPLDGLYMLERAVDR